MRVRVPDDDAHSGLVAAVARHPRMELVTDPAAVCDVGIAIDDAPLANVATQARYRTRPSTGPGAAVASRYLLSAASPAQVVAPLPVESGSARQRHARRVAVVGSRAESVAAELGSAGVSVVDPSDHDVGVVVDTNTHESVLADVRGAMAGERVVVGLASNPAVADSIHDATSGRLLERAEDLVPVVQQLLSQPSEIDRLGYEARVEVERACWGRVVRALTLRSLGAAPKLDRLGALAARRSWVERLGHAWPWADARLVSTEPVVLARSDSDETTVDLGTLSVLRTEALAHALDT